MRIFQQPRHSRHESEKSGGPRKSDGGVLTSTTIQVSEVLEDVCVHFGVDTHPICDKCQMRHNPAGGCVKTELVMKAFELSVLIVKAVAQAELTVKQSVIKAKDKELRSSDVKVLENLAKEVSVLDSSLNKMFKQAESGLESSHGKDKKKSMSRAGTVINGSTGNVIAKIAPLSMTRSRKAPILQQANQTTVIRKLAKPTYHGV